MVELLSRYDYKVDEDCVLSSNLFRDSVSHKDLDRHSADAMPPRAQGDAPVKVVRCTVP
jgi:hypothetical protein